MRLLLAGGGTGGHLFPAVAIAEELFRLDAQAEVLFVGTERGLESRLLPKLGLSLATVDMVGVVGRGWRGKLQLLPKLIKSLGQAHKIFNDFHPDLVIGVGGYASVPALLVAKLKGIPYLLHEQNAIAGLSNKLLGRGAARVCASFESSCADFPAAKVVVTGNPVRPALEQVASALPQPGTLLIFGGSRGARAINQAVIEMLPLLQQWSQRPRILHQTGEDDFAMVQQAYRAVGLDEKWVVPFIDDMASAYAEAGLVVCRAGATTLAELAVCGRPAILIPYPFAAADHQTANARALEQGGAAQLLPQSELTAVDLLARIRGLFEERQLLEQMGLNSRKLGQRGAAGRILQECRTLLQR
jgi:UDP-N-acetylglucosamine--N-acetylmuramyl-(pentapeptide) pyrophosphoryl-undecaprenol N-acetylglucosamine transferase